MKTFSGTLKRRKKYTFSANFAFLTLADARISAPALVVRESPTGKIIYAQILRFFFTLVKSFLFPYMRFNI